jgi:hypothetical protein
LTTDSATGVIISLFILKMVEFENVDVCQQHCEYK